MPPKMPTSASTLCPSRCPLDGALARVDPETTSVTVKGLVLQSLPVPSLCCINDVGRDSSARTRRGEGRRVGIGGSSGEGEAGAGPSAAKTTVAGAPAARCVLVAPLGRARG